MPASYAGTIFRATGSPINDLSLPAGMTRPIERDVLDTLAHMNAQHHAIAARSTAISPPASPPTNSRTECKPTRPKPSTSAQETEATKKMYGVDQR